MNYMEILQYFPSSIRIGIDKELQKNEYNYRLLEEIRLRVKRPVILKFGTSETILPIVVKTEEILETLQHICDHSIYSYQKQICSGFITVKGGHRIGIAGSAVITDGKISNLNYISNLNFRIARQVLGCSHKILKYMINQEENTIYNTLIASEPGAGKTTILRDAIRRISDGIEEIHFPGKNVGVVDERGEIAAMYRGIPQNDVGLRTDVMDNVEKDIGMKMLIRSMAPQIIVADEIGSTEDVKAIEYAACSGVKGIFTAHGKKIEDLKQNPAIAELMKTGILERILFLNGEQKGEIKKAYAFDKMNKEYILL